MRARRTHAAAARRGSALITSLIVVSILATVVSSALVMHVTHEREVGAVANRTRALYAAETGLNEALVALKLATDAGDPAPAGIGTKEAQVHVAGGRYWCAIDDNADGSYTVSSHGGANLARRSVRAVLRPVASVFDHAIFAGNSDGDPAYALRLGGSGAQADSITGNVYSGGDVEITGDAGVTGDIEAGGAISGASGTEGASRPVPDIAAMDYANTSDVDVAALFGAATWEANDLGGSAWQLPEDSPAHIFRKNPDDRLDEIDLTPKDDYFLEDPYMPVKDFTVAATGKEGHSITLSGIMGRPGPSGTEKVYFIDGNLWVHNKPFGRLRVYNTEAEGAKVTFVVRGNVYFSDDVYIEDPAKDGLAFIAIEDPAEPDSGNIYLGDPRYGTLEDMEAFLYAENDFIDNNLDETGSAEVTITGNMTAGNQVRIERDYLMETGEVQHSRLSVVFDDRLSTGALELPSLPQPVGGVEGFEVAFWREVAPE